MSLTHPGRSSGAMISLVLRFLIGLVAAIMSLVGYFAAREYNPTTEEVQYIGMTVEQEIALGLQAAPKMAAQYGGLDPDEKAQARVQEVGESLVERTAADNTSYRFRFHVLDDPRTINAFALPGGFIFITRGLLSRLQTKGQLAGVLAHEIGHVVARHAAEHIAKARLTQGLTGAAVIAMYDPNNPASQRTLQVAQLIGQLVSLKFSRSDELESDRLGVRFLAKTGYDPRAIIKLMEVLDRASTGPRRSEFFNTHPNPENRIDNIQAAIAKEFPAGVPEGLKQ
jgi:beta-barrel assembly-enhancing protease